MIVARLFLQHLMRKVESPPHQPQQMAMSLQLMGLLLMDHFWKMGNWLHHLRKELYVHLIYILKIY